MSRLACTLAVSLTLHILVLCQNLSTMTHHAPADARSRLTARIDPLATSTSATAPSFIPAPHQGKDNGKTAPAPNLPPAHAETWAREARENSQALDIGRILQQARNYATREMRASEPAPFLFGDYYGSYDGADTGTFSVQLDASGRIAGSAQSSANGISLLITGRVDANGLIQMSGKGAAGNAQFTGTLNMKTGKIAGSWKAGRLAQGSFSGRREN